MDLRKNSIAIRLSRETLLDFGLVDPTPEEQSRMDAARARRDADEVAALPRMRQALAELTYVTDPVARAVLNLHARAGGAYPTCQGCDCDGYDWEPPAWPCRTVTLVATTAGINWPAGDFARFEVPQL